MGAAERLRRQTASAGTCSRGSRRDGSEALGPVPPCSRHVLGLLHIDHVHHVTDDALTGFFYRLLRGEGKLTAGSTCRSGCCVPSSHGLRLENIDAERVAKPGNIEISVSHHQALTERQRGPCDERISGRKGLAVLVAGGL